MVNQYNDCYGKNNNFSYFLEYIYYFLVNLNIRIYNQSS